MKFEFGQKIIDQIRGKKKLCSFPCLTFSQTGEDVLISGFIQNLKLKNFSWIDIGAHHPVYLSNTAWFYKNGYRGINIEGDPSLIGKFYKKRPKDINLNILISDKSGKQVFYLIDPPTLNTLSKDEALEYEKMGYKIKDKIEIESMTVPEVINKYNKGCFPDFLSLDAEGYDFEILKTIEWEKSFPKIICVEIAKHLPTLQDNFDYMTNNKITEYLLNKGYFIAAYTGNNTIFVQRKLIEGIK